MVNWDLNKGAGNRVQALDSQPLKPKLWEVQLKLQKGRLGQQLHSG